MFVAFLVHTVDGIRARRVRLVPLSRAENEETCKPVHPHIFSVAIAVCTHK